MTINLKTLTGLKKAIVLDQLSSLHNQMVNATKNEELFVKLEAEYERLAQQYFPDVSEDDLHMMHDDHRWDSHLDALKEEEEELMRK